MPAPSLAAVERIGHRGAPRELPENSLPAFERALELGAQAVELDVHVTADGVAVVHHDACLGHGVDGAFGGQAITALSWTELQSVELAPGVTIPSLAQVLDLVGERATTYVELKGACVEEAALEAIARAAGPCAVHGFDHRQVARAARLAPEVPRGILFDAAPTDLADSIYATGARDVWLEWSLVDHALASLAHSLGARIIAWTVNTRAGAQRLADLGVDGVCTDDLPDVFPGAVRA